MKTTSLKSRIRPVYWGIVLIVAAVLLILDASGTVKLGSGITWWRILLGALFGSWFVYELVQLKIPNIFFPLAFGFLVFEAPIANALGKGDDIISNWIVLLAALMLTIGFSVIMPKHNWVKNANLGRHNHYFDAGKDLKDACIHDNVGNVEAYVTNRESYNGNGVITIMDNLGRITIHLPGTWLVAVQAQDNIGNIDIPEQNYSCSKSITLVVKDNLGQIKVVFD